VALGLAYWDKNDYPHALESFQRAVKVGPTSAEAHNWLGVALLEKADFARGHGRVQKGRRARPEIRAGLYEFGSSLAKGGELAGAVEAFQKALALEPNSLAAHMNLGVALREKAMQKARLRIYAAWPHPPSNANVQYELGQTLRQSGDLAGAISAFEKALQIDPELREGYYALGVALKQQSASTRKPSAVPASLRTISTTRPGGRRPK